MMSAPMRVSWAKPSREQLLSTLASKVSAQEADAYASARWCLGNASAIPNDGTGIAQAMPGDELKRFHEQIQWARSESQLNELVGQIHGANMRALKGPR